MIFVCDHTESARAAELREKLYRMGYPAAMGAVSDYRRFLPAGLIVTFSGVLDEIRRTPMDDIHAIVIGDGFVNSALNAQPLRNPEDLPDVIRIQLYRQFGIVENAEYTFGVFVHRDVFFADDFFEVRGRCIVPTRAEYMCFKYLMADRSGKYIPSEVIWKYCCPSEKHNEDFASVAVHVSNLNKKAKQACGFPIIESMRFSGYRSAIR